MGPRRAGAVEEHWSIRGSTAAAKAQPSAHAFTQPSRGGQSGLAGIGGAIAGVGRVRLPRVLERPWMSGISSADDIINDGLGPARSRNLMMRSRPLMNSARSPDVHRGRGEGRHRAPWGRRRTLLSELPKQRTCRQGVASRRLCRAGVEGPAPRPDVAAADSVAEPAMARFVPDVAGAQSPMASSSCGQHVHPDRLVVGALLDELVRPSRLWRSRKSFLMNVSPDGGFAAVMPILRPVRRVDRAILGVAAGARRNPSSRSP